MAVPSRIESGLVRRRADDPSYVEVVRMNFGVFLNQYYTPGGPFEVTDLYEQTDLIERVGFDLVAVGERHVHEEGVVEPLAALSGLAARTEHLDLATTAMLPAIHHPLHLAERIAILDRLSEGRAIFGGAIGYRERELTPFGVSLEDRVPRFLESLELIRDLLAGERVSHESEHYDLDDVFVRPTPVDEIPIWIGGHADVAIKRAAYRGDAWIASASSTTADLQDQIRVYEKALEEFGHDREDHEIVLMRDCFVADSIQTARRTIEPHLLRLYKLYARWGQTYLAEHDVEVDYDELAEKFVIGSPGDCIERLETYADLGIDTVIVRCQYPGQPQDVTLDALERFGTEVIPALQ